MSDETRLASAEHWEAAAPGWTRRQDEIRMFGAPVSHWMVQAIDPQPGQRVLELAAGLGETGFLAAELVAPVGGVIVSDQAEAMLEGARARAHELALTNIEFQVMGAEWIDLPVASVDAVLCRWGYMLMADPLAALLETRRVLRPGGRLALAVWDRLELNPWAQAPAAVLREHGLAPPPEQQGTSGPFALADPERLGTLLEEAGFTEILVDTIAVEQRPPSFTDFWETTLDLSRNFHDAVLSLPEEQIGEVRTALIAQLEPYTAQDGSLVIPGSSLVAAAGA
ncbi:MAG TPA: methyltransferase domain-containing protein [Solirubrobacteraceae bacterium]|jgi:SAM-dependent methyltransferase